MTGQATFSLEDDDLAAVLAVSDFLAADLSADPFPFEEADSVEGVLAEESSDCLSLTAVAAEPEPFLLSVR
jgi:hypothetical protein